MQVRLKRSRFHPWVGKIPGEGFGNPSGIPAWRILWTEEPGGLQARGSQSRTWLQQFSMHTHTHTHSRKYKSTECQECQVGWPQLCKSISQLATYSAEYNIKCKIQQNGFILFTCFQTALWSYLFMVEAGQRWGRIRERSSMWCSSNTTDSELADGGRLKGIKLMIIVTWLVCACSVAKSAWFFVTSWTVAHHVPLCMEFSRQEYWSGLPFPSPGEPSWPRDWTWVSYVCRLILYHWATWEALNTGKCNEEKCICSTVLKAVLPNWFLKGGQF